MIQDRRIEEKEKEKRVKKKKLHLAQRGTHSRHHIGSVSLPGGAPFLLSQGLWFTPGGAEHLCPGHLLDCITYKGQSMLTAHVIATAVIIPSEPDLEAALSAGSFLPGSGHCPFPYSSALLRSPFPLGLPNSFVSRLLLNPP